MTRIAAPVPEQTEQPAVTVELVRMAPNETPPREERRTMPCATDEEQAVIAGMIEHHGWDFATGSEPHQLPDWYLWRAGLLPLTLLPAGPLRRLNGQTVGPGDRVVVRTDSPEHRDRAVGLMEIAAPPDNAPEWLAEAAAKAAKGRAATAPLHVQRWAPTPNELERGTPVYRPDGTYELVPHPGMAEANRTAVAAARVRRQERLEEISTQDWSGYKGGEYRPPGAQR